MNHQLIKALDQIEREKGIEKSTLIRAVEAAIVSAAKRNLGTTERLEAHLSMETGEIEVFALKEVIEVIEDPDTQISLREAKGYIPDIEVGDEIEIRRNIEGLGRIAAQTAKQVIVQRVREAEREMVYERYRDRVNELVNGIVTRVERGNAYVDLGRAEALLPWREQSPRDRFHRGDRVRAYVIEVRRASQGPQVILSRTHEGLLRKLFEMEVPEVHERTVHIVNAVREPGGRSKISVTSSDPNVDPVGACVGMKGSRVQAVVRELRGENIDIISHSEDSRVFITAALSPAQIDQVRLNDDRHVAEVIVEEDQQSLAIGKKGQNVRLASRLTGWNIEIKTADQLEAEASAFEHAREIVIGRFQRLSGVGEQLATTIFEHGFHSIAALAEAETEALRQIPGVGETRAVSLIEAATQELAVLAAEAAEAAKAAATAEAAETTEPTPASEDPGPAPESGASSDDEIEPSIDPQDELTSDPSE